MKLINPKQNMFYYLYGVLSIYVRIVFKILNKYVHLNGFKGGVPDENFLLRRDLFKGNFHGCINEFNSQNNIITDFQHYESVNIDSCDIS